MLNRSKKKGLLDDNTILCDSMIFPSSDTRVTSVKFWSLCKFPREEIMVLWKLFRRRKMFAESFMIFLLIGSYSGVNGNDF